MILARCPERPRGAPDAVVFVPSALGWEEKQKKRQKKKRPKNEGRLNQNGFSQAKQ